MLNRIHVGPWIAVVWLVLLCCLTTGCGKSESAAVESVLAQDKQLSDQAKAYMGSGTSPAQAIAWLAQNMKAIDTSSCPPKFRSAYLRHCNAWEGLAQQIAQEPQSFGEALITGFLNGLTGELDGGAGRMMDARNRHVEAIRTTWAEVEAQAVECGAKLKG